MPNAKIGKVNLATDTINTQRLRFNQLIDSVGSVSLTNVNQTAGRSTFTGTYPTVAEALKEHEARLDSADIIEVVTPRIRAFDSTYDNIFAGDVYMQSNVDIGGNLQIDGTLTVDGVVNMKAGSSGTVTLGDDNTDNVVFDADINSNVIPNTTNAFDLGSSTQQWRHGYFDGTLNTDNLLADSATIANNAAVVGNLDVDGVTTLDVTTIDGQLTVNAPTLMTDALTVEDSAYITGNFDIGGDLDITGNATSTGWALKIAAESGTTDEISLGNTITFSAGEGINTTVSNNQITIAGEHATNSNIGIASFSSSDFDVNTGVVTINSIGNNQIDNSFINIASEAGTTNAVNLGETLTLAAGEGINTTVANNTITIAGELASDTNIGAAKFDNGDFAVSNGNVTLANLTTGAVLGIDGTTNEVEVSRTNGTVTVGLPNNVTITNDLGIGGNFTIGGDFIITGAQKLASAFVELLDGTTGAPSANAGISIDRGTQDSAVIQWNETSDYWEASYNNAATPSRLVAYANLDTTDFTTGATITISDEAIQDMVGAMVTGNTETDITVTYQDGDGTLDFVLDDTTVTAGSYGSTTSIPSFTVDGKGRLTNVTPVSIATTLTISDDSLDSDAVDLLNDKLRFSEGEGINAAVTNNKVTISAELATSTNKGVASFSTDNFSVSNGVVTIKDNGVILGTETTGNYMSGISGTANEIEVSHTPGEGSSATVGLPSSVTVTTDLTTGQDVFVGRNLDVTGNAVIDGNLTISGTTTTVNTETVAIADNIILLNSNAANTPTQNGGIEIERGNSTNVQLRWNEANDYWQVGEGNDPVYTRVATAGWLNAGGGLSYNSSTGEFAHTDTSSQGSVNNTGNSFIQDISLDTYGHITDIVSGSVTVGDATITLAAGSDLHFDETDRTFTTNQSTNQTLTIDHDNITRTNTNNASAPAFGGTFTAIDSLTSNARGHVTGVNTKTVMIPALGTFDNYVSWSFLEGNGGETGTITSGDTLHFEQGTGMQIEKTADDQLTFTNVDRGSLQSIFKRIIPEAADGSDLDVITAGVNDDIFYIRAGGGITLASDAASDRMTISHTDTSDQGSSNNSGRTYIQDIMLDTYGHVTGISTATETVTDTNQLTTFQVEDHDGTEVTISHNKEWKFREGGGVRIIWTDTNPGSNTDPFDLTFETNTGVTAGNGLTGGGTLNVNRTINVGAGNGITVAADEVKMSGSYTGSFSATGNITAYSSDERLKENIAVISDPIRKLKSIGGYSYTWNEEAATAVGFTPESKDEHGVIAQEIQKVIPDAVTSAPFDTDEDGNSKSGEDYLTVRYERIVPLLIEAIKDQQVQIDKLKKELQGR